MHGPTQDQDNVKKATENIKQNLKVYPLSQASNPPKMEFKDMSGLAGYNTIMPNDYSFFEFVRDRSGGGGRWSTPNWQDSCRDRDHEGPEVRPR